MSRTERKSGVVKLWSERGYGFIRFGGDDHETYFHVSDWCEDDEPRQDDRVTFVESHGRDGRPRAKSVQRSAI